MSSLQNTASHGTVFKATTPTLPAFADLNFTYGQKIIGFDLGEQPGLTYALTVFHPGFPIGRLLFPTIFRVFSHGMPRTETVALTITPLELTTVTTAFTRVISC